MSPEQTLLTPDERAELELTVLAGRVPDEQYVDAAHQQGSASLGMWIFLATEVLFFGTMFLGLFTYRHYYAMEFEAASRHLNFVIGGANTVVLLVSSVMMVLAVHSASTGHNGRVQVFLALTALLGAMFLGFKAFEYVLDFRDNLVPGACFDDAEWVSRDGLTPGQVPHVKLFLIFYWVMTGLHAVHMTIGIGAVAAMFVMARRGHFSPEYYAPLDVTGLYWHFVDMVWIFLLPSLYLLGTHTLRDVHL
jgi:cytochrome c oxidase subunit 3